MSTPEETQRSAERWTVYIVIGVIVVTLMIIGLLAYSSNQHSKAAQDKADQLSAALTSAGVQHVPSQDQIIGVLGVDGGATCEDPGSALARATLSGMLVNGAAGPGIRPVVADYRAVKGELLIIKIYCPDKLPQFQKVVNDLDLDTVIRG